MPPQIAHELKNQNVSQCTMQAESSGRRVLLTHKYTEAEIKKVRQPVLPMTLPQR